MDRSTARGRRESSVRQPERSRNSWLTAGAIWLLLAAVLATFIAWLKWRLNCGPNCSDGKTWQTYVQFGLALLGLAAAVCMTYWTWVGSNRRALWALGATVLLYLAWVLFVLHEQRALYSPLS
jgi:hypothetical protein